MKKRCKRRIWPLGNAVTVAIQGACVMDEARLQKIRTIELMAIEAFRSGKATVSEWRSICDMSNLAQTLCEMGVGKSEVLPVAEDVERHLLEAYERHERTGKLGTTGPGLKAFADLYEYHDLQRLSVDLSTYEKAIVKTVNRIRSGHPDLKVLT